MKEICGFEDSKGRFHKTKEAAELAECQIRIIEIERTLHSFEREVDEILFRSREHYSKYSEIETVRNIIFSQVSKVILKDWEKFYEVILLKQELQNELDTLRKADKGDTWWLKLK